MTDRSQFKEEIQGITSHRLPMHESNHNSPQDQLKNASPARKVEIRTSKRKYYNSDFSEYIIPHGKNSPRMNRAKRNLDVKRSLTEMKKY